MELMSGFDPPFGLRITNGEKEDGSSDVRISKKPIDSDLSGSTILREGSDGVSQTTALGRNRLGVPGPCTSFFCAANVIH